MKLHPIFSSLGSVVLALLLSAASLAPAASAQSVDAVIDRMKARYQDQIEAVDTYVIETNNYTSYHRKVSRNGEAVYETQTRWHGQEENLFGGFGGSTTALQPGLAQLDTLAMHSTYLGTETVDGRTAHVLLVDDPSAFGGYDDAPEDVEGELRFYVDADEYVPLRMEYALQIEQGDRVQTVTPHVRLSDYRTVDGLTLPWKMEMRMENLNAAISAEEREEARRSLEELEARMEEMPDEQRRMMEGMMKNQLEQFRKIVEDGTIEFSVEVQDVKVNVPIPDDVFEE